MRAIWNIISSTAPSEPVFGGVRARPLTVVRRAGVRGLRLVVDPRDGAVRLTLGPRAALKPALAWVEGKRPWVERQLARLPTPVPIVPDMVFALGDELVRLEWATSHPRSPLLLVGPDSIRAKAAFGPAEGRSWAPDQVRGDGFITTHLRVGGPREQLAARVLRFLRSHAAAVLARETHALAAANGITVAKVAVGDPKSRWGSCAASGDIRYSWRLILAPGFVRRATVAHEVAHRVHMNHGAAFHRLAAELNGANPSPARAWLRAHGPALHWFGRDG